MTSWFGRGKGGFKLQVKPAFLGALLPNLWGTHFPVLLAKSSGDGPAESCSLTPPKIFPYERAPREAKTLMSLSQEKAGLGRRGCEARRGLPARVRHSPARRN